MAHSRGRLGEVNEGSVYRSVIRVKKTKTVVSIYHPLAWSSTGEGWVLLTEKKLCHPQVNKEDRETRTLTSPSCSWILRSRSSLTLRAKKTPMPSILMYLPRVLHMTGCKTREVSEGQMENIQPTHYTLNHSCPMVDLPPQGGKLLEDRDWASSLSPTGSPVPAHDRHSENICWINRSKEETGAFYIR